MSMIESASCTILYRYFALILRYASASSEFPWLLRGVGNIGRNDDALHVVMEPAALCGSLCDVGRELSEVCCGVLAPIEGHRHDVDHHLLNGCCRQPLGSSLDGAEQLVQVVFVDCLKIRSNCCAKDWIGDLGSDNQCNRGRYGLFTPIAASRAVFCLSASSCALAFVVISGATMLIVKLAACASAINCLLTSLFLMATLDL